MKKSLFLLAVFILLSSCVLAQPSFPPRNPRLFYQWWYEDYLSQNNATLIPVLYDTYLKDDSVINNQHCDPWERANYFYTDTQFTVVGIAIGAFAFYSGIEKGGEINTKEMFLNLYEVDGDSLLMLRNIPLISCRVIGYEEIDTTANRQHNIDSILFDANYFPHISSIDTCLSYYSVGGRFLYEYYFDEPVTVSDSFYLSFGCQNLGRTFHALTQLSVDNMASIPGVSRPCVRNVQQPEFPKFKYKYRLLYYGDTSARPLYQWLTAEAPFFPLIFPILQYADCKEVKNLHRSWWVENEIRFEWDSNDRMNRGWEFTFVPEGQSPETGTIIPCSEPRVQITFDPDIAYRAYVRQKCIGDQYGDWGNGLHFGYGETSISNPAEDATIVTPNPTTGEVSVTSPHKLRQVEIYDMSGALLLSLQCQGENANIDLSNHAAGTYLLKIYTDNGTITKTVIKK